MGALLVVAVVVEEAGGGLRMQLSTSLQWKCNDDLARPHEEQRIVLVVSSVQVTVSAN